MNEDITNIFLGCQSKFNQPNTKFMRPIKTTLTALLFIAVILPCVSCKKESATPAPRSSQEKLLGKWNLISEVTNDHYSGSDHITTYPFSAGDHMDFNNAGTVSEYKSGTILTYGYGVINESRIWLIYSGNDYDLKFITDNDLQLHIKDVTGADYYESTLNLKR